MRAIKDIEATEAQNAIKAAEDIEAREATEATATAEAVEATEITYAKQDIEATDATYAKQDTSSFIRPGKSWTKSLFSVTQFVTQFTHVSSHYVAWSRRNKI